MSNIAEKGIRRKVSLAEGIDGAFGEILNALDQGVHIVDDRGVTIFYNQTLENIEGLTRQQVIGKNILESFPSLTSDTSTLYKVLSSGETVRDQVQNYTNKYGKLITTINSTMPLVVDGRTVGAVEIARDISLVRKLQDKIMELQQAIYRESAEPGELTGALFEFSDILGESAALKKAVEYARRAARTGSSILIYGESGTGKEMVAQSIHNASPRWKKPFIAYNCAALPDGLLEGILFGTCRGSFTGAIDRPGLFEQASGGTILLDELNSMGMNLQAKLLRLLQEKKVRRLGSTREIPVDVRVIATVSAGISDLLEKNELRQDLFYRLGVVTVTIPPLRDRRGDISHLTRHFIEKYNIMFDMKVAGVSPAVHEVFMSYQWPGNVRELMHVVEGAMNVMGSEKIIEAEYLPQYILCRVNSSEKHACVQVESGDTSMHNSFLPVKPVMDDAGLTDGDDLLSAIGKVERAMIEKALIKHAGNLSRASRELGIKRQSLQYKIQKYEVEPKK